MSDCDKGFFSYLVQGACMTGVALIGVVCNSLTLYILHDKSIQLKRDFMQWLCAIVCDDLFLVCAFLCFSLPELSKGYCEVPYNHNLPYLFPITNTFMTCSCYMTVAVSVNRCFGTITAGRIVSKITHIENVYIQAFIVLIVSSSINVSRWLKFRCEYIYVMKNVTDSTTKDILTMKFAQPNIIADGNRAGYYLHDYVLTASNIVTILIPIIILIIAILPIFEGMATATNSNQTLRRRHNQDVRFVMVGVIFLFLFCRLGELLVSTYELLMRSTYGDYCDCPEYARNVININHFLVFCNYSLNFSIYWKDAFFRQCWFKFIRALKGNTQGNSRTNTQVTPHLSSRKRKQLSRGNNM